MSDKSIYIKNLPCFIDFEASSLSADSYPIQVAWSLPDGQVYDHFLDPRWVASWTDWDDDAKWEIHRISRALLHDVGAPPQKVAERMNAMLAGYTLYADGLPFDQPLVGCAVRGRRTTPDIPVGEPLRISPSGVLWGCLSDDPPHLRL